MTSLLLVFIVWTGLMPRSSEIQIVSGTIEFERAQVLADGGPVDVELRTLRVTIPFPSDENRQADIVMLYEPTSQLFWWSYYPVSEPDRSPRRLDEMLSGSKFFVTATKIISFHFSRPDLRIRECAERYSSIEEGQAKAFAELKSKAGELRKGRWIWYHEVNVGKALGDFLLLKGSAFTFPEASLREITRKDGRWHIIFDGPNKDTAEVVLDDKFELVSAAVLPSQAP